MYIVDSYEQENFCLVSLRNIAYRWNEVEDLEIFFQIFWFLLLIKTYSVDLMHVKRGNNLLFIMKKLLVVKCGVFTKCFAEMKEKNR